MRLVAKLMVATAFTAVLLYSASWSSIGGDVVVARSAPAAAPPPAPATPRGGGGPAPSYAPPRAPPEDPGDALAAAIDDAQFDDPDNGDDDYDDAAAAAAGEPCSSEFDREAYGVGLCGEFIEPNSVCSTLGGGSGGRNESTRPLVTVPRALDAFDGCTAPQFSQLDEAGLLRVECASGVAASWSESTEAKTIYLTGLCKAGVCSSDEGGACSGTCATPDLDAHSLPAGDGEAQTSGAFVVARCGDDVNFHTRFVPDPSRRLAQRELLYRYFKAPPRGRSSYGTSTDAAIPLAVDAFVPAAAVGANSGGGGSRFHPVPMPRGAVRATGIQRRRRRRRKSMDAPELLTPPSVHMIVVDSIARASFVRQASQTSRLLEALRRGDDGAAARTRVYQFFRHSTQGQSTRHNMPQLMRGCAPFPVDTPYYEMPCAATPADAPQAAPGAPQPLGTLAAPQGTLASYYGALGYATAFAGDCHITEPHDAHHMSFTGVDAVPNGEGRAYNPFADDLRQHCLGGRLSHSHSLAYTRQLLAAYARPLLYAPDGSEVEGASARDEPHPAFVLSHLMGAHESSQRGLRLMDAAIASHLRELDLRRTFVVLVGDHGHEMLTHDYHNPFLFILAPAGLPAPMHAALRGNEQRLSTHADVYRMLRQLPLLWADPASSLTRDLFGADAAAASSSSSDEEPLGLFDVLPADRTCAQARIPTLHCLCTVADKHVHLHPVTMRRLRTAIVAFANRAVEKDGGYAGGVCARLRRDLFATLSASVVRSARGGPLLVVRARSEADVSVGERLGGQVLEFKATVRLVKEGPVQQVPRRVAQMRWDDPALKKHKEPPLGDFDIIGMTRVSAYAHERCHAARGGSVGESARPFCVCKDGNKLLGGSTHGGREKQPSRSASHDRQSPPARRRDDAAADDARRGRSTASRSRTRSRRDKAW